MGRPYKMHPDNCERCAGMSRGVRGNENRHPEGVGYRVLCDYCSVEVDSGLDRDIICEQCEKPWGAHVMMELDQVEAIWAQGIECAVCDQGDDYPGIHGGTLYLVSWDDGKPGNPCDEDYMKEISS